MSKKRVLVPHDFTPVAETAVEHAVNTAKQINAEVHLIHIVSRDKDFDKINKKLKSEEDRVRAAHGDEVKISSSARIGNIFDDIGDAAKELEAALIFMGTHGAKGMQHILGSHALKVITNSEIPFIVVQDGTKASQGYNNIVVPMDLSKETRQKLIMVANIASYFDSKVHLVVPRESDEFLKNQLDRNIYFSKQYLRERGIEFTTTVSAEKSFDKAIFNLAEEVKADLVTIVNLQADNLLGGILDHGEQAMITNKQQIPVMVVNPKATTVSGGVFY